MLLKDRVAIITGAAKGIGYAIAKKFAENGSHVVLNVHRDIKEYQGGNEKVKTIESYGVKCLVIKADVSQSKEVIEMVKEAVSRFGKIDVLVNNAAFPPLPKGLVDITEEEWDQVLDVNLKGAFLMCKEVVPNMKKAKYGKVINISAVSGLVPVIPNAHYGASKAGIQMLTQDLALDVAPLNINVNCICPGVIITELLEKVVPPGMDKKTFFDKFAKVNIPMQRPGYPEDIANAALFLASDLSSYITGQILVVAGGAPLARTRPPE